MLTNIRRLFGVLDRWKWDYIVAGSLLILAIFVRSLEPKILQITVDYVIGAFVSEGAQTGSDRIVNFSIVCCRK